MRNQNRTCLRWLAPFLLLLAALPWHAALAGTSAIINNSTSSITCPFSGLCTMTPTTCAAASTCSVSGGGFAVLQANPAGTSVLWTGTVPGCNNVVSDFCNPDLSVSGAITVSTLRTVTLTQSSSSLNEGATPTVTYTATLSGTTTLNVTVNLAFSGTATNVSDYTRSGTSIVIPAGSTTGTVTATVVNDTTDEPNETIVVDISGVTNANENGTQQVTATINDNDNPVNVTLGLSGSPLAEAGGVATVTATLSAVSGFDVTVNLGFTGTAANPADYSRSGTSITILAGATTGTVTLTGVNDTIDEANETVIVDITTVTNGTESGMQQVTATITDDDPPPAATLSLSGSPFAENGGVATVTATLANASSSTVTVNLGFTGTAANPADYTRSGTSIAIPAGSLTGSITLTGVNDVTDEPAETVIVDITTVTNGTESGTQQVTASITDDDPPPTVTLSLAGSPFAENGGTATVTATLSPASANSVTVNLGFSGTAANPADFTPSATSITIAAGATTGSITLTGANDAIDEPAETVIVDITTVTNGTESGTQQVTANITDDDPAPVATIADAGSTPEGGTLNYVVTLDRQSSSNLAINLTYGGSATAPDYSGNVATLTINALSTTGTVSLVTVNDGVYEGDETATVTIAAGTGYTVGATPTGTGTLIETSPIPQAIINFIATPAAPTYSPGGTFAVSATGGGSGNPVVFASTTTGVCTVSGSTVTIVTAGTCSLTADQAGNASYAAAPQVTLDVTIAQAAQAITNFIATPAAPTYAPGGTFSVSATAGASTSPVVFASTTPAICSVAGSTVTTLGAGTCSLTADQAADINYTAAPQVTLDVTIAQSAQAITNFIATPAAPTYAPGGTFSVSATAGASTSPVVFAVTTPAFCSIVGSTVTMLGAGTCSLTADQAGDANYLDAPQVTLDVTIAQASQAITNFIATPAAPTFAPGGTFAVSATAGASTSAVTFATTTPAICSVSGSTVTMLGAGTCTLTADQAGDTNYTAAPQLSIDVTIGQAAQAITNFIATPAAPTLSPGGTFAE
jgi:hypothetical protein